MLNRLLTAAAATLLASCLAACGGGDDEYCDAVKAANAGGGTDELSAVDARERIGEVRDAAPESIRDDWDVLLDAFDDPTAIDPDRFESAVREITDFTQDNCDVSAPVG